jgi:hypothetical protein
MFNWIHHLFNPHCEHCRLEREQNKVCHTCDILRMELEKAQREKELLLSRLLEKPKEPEEPKKIEGSPVLGKPMMSWTTRRQILEAESREAKRKLEERQKELTVEDIEKEIGVSDAVG